MKNTMTIIILAIVLLAVCSGCVTEKFDANKMMRDYYKQQRTYAPFEITGISEFSLKGTDMAIRIENDLNPLSIRSPEPSVAMKALDTVEGVAKAGLLGYFGYKTVDSLSASRDPIIVESQVVQPQVIQVPAATPEIIY